MSEFCPAVHGGRGVEPDRSLHCHYDALLEGKYLQFGQGEKDDGSWAVLVPTLASQGWEPGESSPQGLNRLRKKARFPGKSRKATLRG